jgi:hypothetical protein
MERWRWPWTSILFVLVISQVVQMYFSTEVMAQLKWEAFASGGSNTVTVASNNAVRIHAILPGVNASTTTGILVEFGTNAPVFLSGAQTDMEIIVDRYGVGNPTPFSVSSLGTVTPKGVLILPGPLTIRKSSDSVPVVLVYEKLDSTALTSGTPTQGSSVVSPTTALGDVDVKLEQSADNVTWTECLPGTYNASTVKRFFRVRAVEK